MLLKGVAKSSSLQVLDLGYNSITDEGAEALAAGLKANSSLQVLDLGYNEITDEGAEALAAGLKANSSLQQLDLKFNKITDKGGETLAARLKASSSLKQLSWVGHINLTVKGQVVDRFPPRRTLASSCACCLRCCFRALLSLECVLFA